MTPQKKSPEHDDEHGDWWNDFAPPPAADLPSEPPVRTCAGCGQPAPRTDEYRVCPNRSGWACS